MNRVYYFEEIKAHFLRLNETTIHKSASSDIKEREREKEKGNEKKKKMRQKRNENDDAIAEKTFK